MTENEIIQSSVYNAINTYPVPSNDNRYNSPRMNYLRYRSNKYDVQASLSNTAIICGAAAVGIGIGYYIYKKYFK